MRSTGRGQTTPANHRQPFTGVVLRDKNSVGEWPNREPLASPSGVFASGFWV